MTSSNVIEKRVAKAAPTRQSKVRLNSVMVVLENGKSAKRHENGMSLRSFTVVTDVIWRLVQLHCGWITLLICVFSAINHFCAINFFVTLLVSFALCWPILVPLIIIILTVYIVFFYFFRLYLWYLPYLPPYLSYNASGAIGSLVPHWDVLCPNLALGNVSERYIFTSDWVGLSPPTIPELKSDLWFVWWIVAMSGLRFYASHRQNHRRKHLKLGSPMYQGDVLFPDVTLENFDTDYLHSIKFFLNYGFYKFGFEICIACMAFVASIRMDIVGCILILWILIFITLPRSVIKTIWPIFIMCLVVLFPLQYIMAIGLPVEWCIEYPWNHLLSRDVLDENLSLFLDLANNRMEPYRFYNCLIADFFLLLIASSQRLMFKKENDTHPAGSNSSIYRNEYKLYKNNPRYDFVVEQRNVIDYLKVVVFSYGHWITIVTVLAAGLGGKSFFALGYLIWAFRMLWAGNDLYTMNRYRRTIKNWNMLAYYTVLAMFFKVLSQGIGCSLTYLINFGEPHSIYNFCSIEMMFSIVCVNSVSVDNIKGKPEFLKKKSLCDLVGLDLETKIGLDSVALVFILFQLRILHSWFFQRCMIEFRCELIQARRGAILINQLIEKEMREQNEHQIKKFREIRDRTSAIRKRYEKQQTRNGSLSLFLKAKTYGQAKRSGDYYMFDYDPEADELSEMKTVVPEVTPGASDFNKLGLGQLLHAAITKDLDIHDTLRAVESAERIKDEELRMVAAVAKNERDRDLILQLLQARQQRKLENEVENLITNSTKLSLTTTSTTVLVSLPIPKQPKKKLSFRTKIGNFIFFLLKMLSSASEYAITFLNRRSREHRYVSYVLNKEKEELKRLMLDELYDSKKSPTELRRKWEALNIHLVTNEKDINRFEDEAHTHWESRDIIDRLASAIANFFTAHTDILCFFVAIWAHSSSCGLITLPLPIFVFFWGSLASPRPSKTFWVCMIVYTKAIIVIKFIFQFSFWPWNKLVTGIKSVDNPYEFSHVLGIQRIHFFAVADVMLLVLLFLHRSMLRRLGLWKNANIQETFKKSLRNRAGSDIPRRSPTEKTPLTKLPGKAKKFIPLLPTCNKKINEVTETTASSSSRDIETAESESINGLIVFEFFRRLLRPKFRYIRDLYPLMFFLDLACFMIVAFGYDSFGEGSSGSVFQDIKTNRVPLALVTLLIVILLMIVIDRGLYLRKAVAFKLVYQIITIVVFHIWIFGLLPYITRIQASENSVAKFLYLVKGVYFLVSAWQIRNGYPQLCIGNLLTHSYGPINLFIFRVFLFIPFLFELRTAIDWTWTDTSMPIFDFFNMENFYSIIYKIKCTRTTEQNFPSPRGEAKGSVIKYLMGLPTILGLILVIWCPLLAFSTLNQIGEKSTPTMVQLSVSVEGFPPLYSTQAQGLDLQILPPDVVNLLTNRYISPSFISKKGLIASRQSVAFIKEFQGDGILRVQFRPESETIWQISEESLNALRYQLENTPMNIHASEAEMKILIRLVFFRPRINRNKEPTVHTTTFKIPVTRVIRDGLLSALNPTNSTLSPKVLIPFALPMNVIVPNEGEVKVANDLLIAAFRHNDTHDFPLAYNNFSLTLHSDLNFSRTFWTNELKINKDIMRYGFCLPPEKVKYGISRKREYIELIAFVNRVFPSFLTNFSFFQQGIVAMYIALVVLVHRFIRNFITNGPTDVMISEIPNPDHLLKICLDIYLVREARDFDLEQDLYAKLLFLFRSPATLIRWTRQKIE